MMMFTKLAFLATNSSFQKTVKEAWKTRRTGWFNAGIVLVLLFVVLYWILPKVLPEKKVRNSKYATLTIGSLGIGLLCMFISIASGIGFGLGLGNGSGIGVGDGQGVGVGDGNSEGKQKFVVQGEVDITIIGCTILVDAEPVAIEQVAEYVNQKATDNMKVVLIECSADYGTYMKVASILDELLTKDKYEKRKVD